MTIAQEFQIQKLAEQLEHRIHQREAIKERLASVTSLFEFVRSEEKRLERNIDRVKHGLPLEEDEADFAQDITDWIY